MRDTQLYYCFFLKVAVEFSCHNLVARWLSRYLSSFRPTYLTGLLWGSKGNGMSWGLIWVGGYSDSIQEDEIYFLILYKSYNLRYADDTTLMAENEELKSLLMKVKEMKWSEVNSFSCVQLFETPWTVAFQALPPMGFSRQEYWSGLPFPSPENLPDPGIEPRSPALRADALLSEPQGESGEWRSWLKRNIQKTKIIVSGPISSWEIDGETMETVRDYCFGFQNHCRWWPQPWN